MYAQSHELYSQPIEMDISQTNTGSSYEPDMFGPSFWFTLHNGATTYPYQPTPLIQNGMKQFLINLPLMIPCVACKEHAYNLLKQTNLDAVVSSRSDLFDFFVIFHNYINSRYNKRGMGLEEAKKLYGYDKPGVGSTLKITYS